MWPVAVAAAFAAIVVAAAAAVAAVVAVGIAVVESAAGIAIAVAAVVAGPALEVEVLESVEWFESGQGKDSNSVWYSTSFPRSRCTYYFV